MIRARSPAKLSEVTSPSAGQLGQRLLHLGGQEAAPAPPARGRTKRPAAPGPPAPARRSSESCSSLVRVGGKPRLRVLPQKEGDAGRADRPRWPRPVRCGRCEPAPGHPAGEAERVEQRGIVLLTAGGQALRSPTRRQAARNRRAGRSPTPDPRGPPPDTPDRPVARRRGSA